ncbi:MAG: 30S ribosomal protein S21 [Patescibacteria group bacterium]|nr:30S ribosomal protein S21 [Patescibacteria group bacterium]
MVQFKRKKGESFESFLRRFNKRLQQSGKLFEARKRRYHRDLPNRNKKKNSALVSLKLKHDKEYQRKIGKIEEKTKRW